MKQKLFLFTLLLMQSLWLVAQVGILNNSPAATLDVVGNVLVQQKMYLEAPGSFTSGPDAKLLMIDPNAGSVIKYDITNSSFGPLNYAQFIFRNVNEKGLNGTGRNSGYDTKIDATKYTLAVHGFYFLKTGTNATSVYLLSGSGGGTSIHGQQFYAYIDGTTWRLKGFVNNSQFYEAGAKTNIDLYMDVIIYRNEFITKVVGVQNVDMGASTTKTVPLPIEFQ